MLRANLVDVILQQEKFYDALLESGELNFEILSKSYDCIDDIMYTDLLLNNKNMSKLWNMINYYASDYPICIKIQEIIVSNLKNPTDEISKKVIRKYIQYHNFSMPTDFIKDKATLLFLKSWRLFSKNIHTMERHDIRSNFEDLTDIYRDIDSLNSKDIKSVLFDSLNWKTDKDKTLIRSYLDLTVFK
jgi:hypothetical protein